MDAIAPPPDSIDTLPILIAPHATLKTRARPVQPADEDTVRGLLPRMFSSMYRAPGIGLAAPQVGQLLRVIAIDLMPDNQPRPLSLINPEIVSLSKELATREEGCLSLPGHVRRRDAAGAGEGALSRPDRRTARDRGRRLARRAACSTKSTTWTAYCSSITCRR